MRQVAAAPGLIAPITIPVTPRKTGAAVEGRRSMDSVDQGSGFSVLDGGALVVGSAIASIHILGVWRDNLSGAGWAMIGITFTWVALTAAGPFIYAARRFGR